MKRTCALLCFVILLSCTLAPVLADESLNLLPNGGFEMLDETGMPNGWQVSAYRTQAGYSRITVTDEQAHSGQYSAMVQNASDNDARFVFKAAVEPESLYRLSGYVLVDHMQEHGNGANFGLEGIYAHSDRLFDTQGEWVYLEWYGETGEEQTELAFGVRVGGYGAESVGKAYFDDIALEKVDVLPDGIIASLWYDARVNAPAVAPGDTDEDGSKKQTFLYVMVVLVFLLLYLACKPVLSVKDGSHGTVLFAVVLFTALAARVLLALKVPGYSVDINCFTAWSQRMAERGPVDFYAPDYFCDYPPGYLLLLWPCGFLLKLFGSANPEFSLLIVKSVPILCDMLGACLLFAIGKKKIGSKAACLIAALYALNPVVLINGAAWGQADSVLTLLMLITAVYAMRREWRAALPLFVLSALMKPQALLFAPIGGIWLLKCLCSKGDRKREWRKVGIGLGAALMVAAVIVIPFSIKQPLGWLFELYAGTLSSYAYATLNTANLYYLAGANWTPLATTIPWQLAAGAALFFALFAAYVFMRKRRKNEGRLQRATVIAFLSVAMAFVQLIFALFSVSYTVFGYGMMIYAFAYAIVCLLFERRGEALPFFMALALIGVYVLGVKVHERYLFPATALLLLAYLFIRDRRLLTLCVGFSATTFLNTVIVLENAILFGAVKGHLNNDTLAVNNVLCIVNLLLCGYAGWVGLTGLRESPPLRREEKPLLPASYERMLFQPKDARMRLTARDYVVIGIVTVLYAALAFTNLGSTVAPQTGWISTSREEQVVFEVDSQQPFSVLYYAGVSANDFSISVSEDGQTWSDAYPCRMNEGLCYRWNYAVSSDSASGEVVYHDDSPANVLWLSGRYLRLNAESAGLNLWEIVTRNKEGENLPLRLVSHSGANADMLDAPQEPLNLIDEMDTCVGEPSWYTGTYFDEIYHARTGYEHLHGQTAMEWTHPPLGKLMMSACIALFGMTPFGWRFAGTLIGVLMLPALYLLALQLTHKRSVASVSMIAFSLDLMHYTQTRIATIDSFPVLFIILSYLCMVRYMQTDSFGVSSSKEPKVFDRAFRRTLIPLLLSGIFMGLSIASKWIGMYSAVGLAVLFFGTLYRQYRISNIACGFDLEAESAERQARLYSARELTLKRMLITCGFCVVFFVIIPALIYCLSYIPFFVPKGPMSVGAFLREVVWEQERIFRYHSTPNLGMDHPFYSPWWQWPLILKPMWFVQDKFEPAGFASTIMCMGNPWVFWLGAVAMVTLIICVITKYVNFKGALTLKNGDGDLALLVILIGFLAQYLPWVLVPRGTYMYHYFASVPFIILATAYLLDQIPKPKVRYGMMAVYLIGAVFFFVVFFPYASGWQTSIAWLQAVKEHYPYVKGLNALKEWFPNAEWLQNIYWPQKIYY